MALDILQIGHPTLRKTAKLLTHEQILRPETQQLIQSMINIMHQAPGVGLAAPQIGISQRIIVVEDKAEYTQGVAKNLLKERERKPFDLHILINPEIIAKEGQKLEFYEGCLSVDGFIGIVPRWHAITVEALNEKAERVTIHAKGWYARILQHEIDHINGHLNVDRMPIKTLTTIENYQKYVYSPSNPLARRKK